jgi:hypothetical protein
MDPISTAGTGGITATTPLRVFLSHASDLGSDSTPLTRSWPRPFGCGGPAAQERRGLWWADDW